MNKNAWSLWRRRLTPSLGLAAILCLASSADADTKTGCTIAYVGVDYGRIVTSCVGEPAQYYGYSWDSQLNCQKVPYDTLKAFQSTLHAALLSGKPVQIGYTKQACGTNGADVNVINQVIVFK